MSTNLLYKLYSIPLYKIGYNLSYPVEYAILFLVRLELSRDSLVIALSGNGKGERYEFR